MNDDQIRISPLSQSLCTPASQLISAVISDLDYYSSAAQQAEISKYTAENLLELIRSDPYSVLLATADETPIGFSISIYDDKLIWLAWFGVAKHHRSKGVGQRLLNSTIEHVQVRGCHKIWCDSRTSNTESCGVLRRAGFREICRLENHWYGHDFYLWERFV
jgi:ribosomal protein S18 acetylase RimI-like enzyme